MSKFFKFIGIISLIITLFVFSINVVERNEGTISTLIGGIITGVQFLVIGSLCSRVSDLESEVNDLKVTKKEENDS